jgi:hypothetical protein
MINLKVINDVFYSTILYKLITFNDILDYFLVIKEIQKDSLQVKLLQSFMNLIHPDYIHFANLSFVEKVN